jgi:hypothetical protein
MTRGGKDRNRPISQPDQNRPPEHRSYSHLKNLGRGTRFGDARVISTFRQQSSSSKVPTHKRVIPHHVIFYTCHFLSEILLPSQPMPRRRRLVPLRNTYSPDLKQRVIYQAFTLGKSSTEISINLNIPLRVVQRVKQTWQELGVVCRNRRGMGREPLLSPQQTQVCFR